MKNIQPTEAQLSELMDSTADGPVVMVNLIKLNRDDDGTTTKSRDSYDRYLAAAAPFGEAAGAKLLFMGEQNQVLIGDTTDEWDLHLLIEYPSRKALIEMVTNPEYMKIHELRENALANSALLVTTPTFKRR
jgi:uncharacterized protein (DUF1330 family)